MYYEKATFGWLFSFYLKRNVTVRRFLNWL